MTREFNKPERDGSRPPSRQHNNPSFKQYGEERSPRPARPRLSRDAVDRGWESGAQNRHADYRPRQNSQGQAPHNGRRNFQQPDRPSYQNGANSNRAYGYRQRPYDSSSDNPQGNYRRNNSSGPRSRPYNAERRDGPHTRGFERDRQDVYGRPTPHNYERNERSFRERPNRYDDNNRRNDQRRQPWDRNGYDGRRQNHGYDHNGSEEYTSPYQAQFEGDYEHFNQYDDAPDSPNRQHTTRSSLRDKHPHDQVEEHHVTRLPDGRVLKGSRPAQRKKAQFWGQIAQDRDSLVEQVHTPVEQENTLVDAQPASPTEQQSAPSQKPAKPARKPHATKKSANANAARPRSSGPKPSQRGFKWPAP